MEGILVFLKKIENAILSPKYRNCMKMPSLLKLVGPTGLHLVSNWFSSFFYI